MNQALGGNARCFFIGDTEKVRKIVVALIDSPCRRLAGAAGRSDGGRQDAHGQCLHAVRDASPWLFPATDKTRPVCVKSLGKQLADRQREPQRRMTGRSKATETLMLPGGRWTAHDLRRTAATLMAGLGVSGDVIDECLNHMIESRVRRTYIRDRRPAEQARAFDALGARLAQITGIQNVASNVVPMRAA